jgi:methionyl aminopeptidase
MSPNAQVVHGIPNNTPLVSGDIISIIAVHIKTVITVIMPILLK